MTLTLPPPTEKVVAVHGGMNQTWYEKLRTAFGFVDRLNSAFGDAQGQLGTAAFKDIGTSGETVPLLSTANTFSLAQTFDVVELTDAATITWDWSLGPIAKVTLGGNRTLAAPTGTNGKAGTWALLVYQGGAGGHTLALDTSYRTPDGEALELAAEAGHFDLLSFITDGTSIAVGISLNHKPT